MRRPLHRQGRGDGSQDNSHRLLQRCVAGGSLDGEAYDGRRRGCRRTHSRGSPCDIHGIRLSDSSRQRVCCALQEVSLLLTALSSPIPSGTQGHRRCPADKAHELENTSSYNSLALAV